MAPIKGEPHLLAFVFSASASLDVFVEVMRVVDGSKTDLEMVLRADLSSPENAVYTAEYVPEEVGWYIAQYRAMAAGTNELVFSNTSRFRAEENLSVDQDEGPASLTRARSAQSGMVTSIVTSMLNVAGTLSFRTRSK